MSEENRVRLLYHFTAAEQLAELRKAGGNACTALDFSGLERQLKPASEHEHGGMK